MEKSAKFAASSAWSLALSDHVSFHVLTLEEHSPGWLYLRITLRPHAPPAVFSVQAIFFQVILHLHNLEVLVGEACPQGAFPIVSGCLALSFSSPVLISSTVNSCLAVSILLVGSFKLIHTPILCQTSPFSLHSTLPKVLKTWAE